METGISTTSSSREEAFTTDQLGTRRHRSHADTAARDLADVAALRLALAVTERRFAAALRQIERMRRRGALYAQQVALLEESVAKAQHVAYRDELTGLPNRHVLFDRFNQAAILAARHDKHFALLFIDLDGFKYVNDTLGHSAGDQLLKQVATRLVGGIRTSDTVCRYGGDEFVVLLAELGGREDALAVANSLRAQLAAPYLVAGVSITITTSLGVGVYPVDAHGYLDLIHVSDAAMYRHKSAHSAPPSILDAAVAVTPRSADRDLRVDGSPRANRLPSTMP
jgi:diguanylate cyclase (GGDEF)-like protein